MSWATPSGGPTDSMKKLLKNRIARIGAVAFLIGALGFSLMRCHSQLEDQKISNLQPKDASIKIANNVSVEILPEIELLAGVLSHTSWMEKEGPEGNGNEYFQKLKGFLEPYKKHRAVRIAQLLTWLGFTYDAPPSFILQLSKLPALEKPSEGYSKYISYRGKSKWLLEEYRLALRDLATKSRFIEFYNENASLYLQLLSESVEGFPAKDITGWLENYFGVTENEFHIVFAPAMFPSGGYGGIDMRRAGKRIVYEIRRASGQGGPKPIFSLGDELVRITIHEFCHSFVNPALESHRALAEQLRLEEYFQPVSKIMDKQAYGSFQNFMNETVVRAATARAWQNLGYKNYNTEDYAMIVEQEKKNGFYLLDFTIQQLEYYEQHRDEYKNFEEFVPYLYGQYAKRKKDLPIIEQQQGIKADSEQ